MKVRIAILTLVLAAGLPQSKPAADFEKLPFAPRKAVCYRTAGPLKIDGMLEEDAWRAAPWSEPFVDIQGDRRPPLDTRVKILWDDEFMYFGAQLEEPDLWATLKERDSVIFQDNDFEIFIDPDGDTHAYYELEVNAFGTAWDLFLAKPYRDGGPAIHAWDIAGLQVGVDVRGTINRPGDRDNGWTVEIAIPWKILREAAPNHARPKDGDRWRVNYSRVQWTLDVNAGAYTKRLDGKNGKPLPEDNWVWSPQGAINMHMPERWGFVQFSEAVAGTKVVPFVDDPNEQVKWALRRLYYRQRQHQVRHGRYATDLATLNADNIRVEGLDFRPSMQATDTQYEIRVEGFKNAVLRVQQDGRVW
jgi:Carbohydrate family 9 binding domain-like